MWSSGNFWAVFFPPPRTFRVGQCPVLSGLLTAVDILGDLNAEMVTVAGSHCTCQIDAKYNSELKETKIGIGLDYSNGFKKGGGM